MAIMLQNGYNLTLLSKNYASYMLISKYRLTDEYNLYLLTDISIG